MRFVIIDRAFRRWARCTTVAIAVGALFATASPVVAAGPESGEPTSTKKAAKKRPRKPRMPALKFTMKDIDGKDQDLGRYYGDVVLMVNTASKCGLTPQYEGLQSLHHKYKDRGFVILAFPANDFGAQEPGANSEIKEFCKTKFDVSFPIFAKVSVKGDDICDLYKYLTAADRGHRHGGEIRWNFNKFLIDRRGRVIDRFEPPVKPDDPKLIKAVERALKRKAPKDAATKPPKEKPAAGGDAESHGS
jgi:glutathione peroxidase